MQFTGLTLKWLQASRAHERSGSWEEFVRAVCVKFGREEFQNLL